MKRNASAFVFALLLFLAIPAIAWGATSGEPHSPVIHSKAYELKDQLWEGFRSHYKYHIQTLAVSKSNPDNSSVLVIAEPPPHATKEAIESILKQHHADYHIETKVHRIGYDGWVKDLVVVLRSDTPSTREALLTQLHEYLFHTPYKTDFLYLEEGPSPPDDINLNLSIAPFEFKQWLEAEERFYPIGGGDTMAITSLLNRRGQGAFFSERPGFVIWALPIGGDISGSEEAIRQFAIDSDLILGAVSNGQSIAIIGRERATPINLLPPLRTETIQLIAAADKQELGQSYERNKAFAGHLDNGKDWAPIYLSPELINSEFGSLLNIADQLLKSWSSNGDVAYYDFPYPPPPQWCFDQPLMDILKANSLTFNWNTRGAFYAVNFGDLDYLLLNRTGSLPMTYIPNENDLFSQSAKDVAPYEKQGYDCYAQWQDPNLIRVVQYTSLFEIFRNFDITARSPMPPSLFESSVLENEVAQLLEDIAALDKEGIEEMAYQFVNKSTNCQGPKDWCEKQIRRRSVSYVPEFRQYADQVKEGLSVVKSKYGASGHEVLVGVLTDPEYARSLEPVSMVELNRINAVVDITNDISGAFGFFRDAMVEKEAVRDKYAKDFEGITGKWIKTPSVVLSWNKSNAEQESQNSGRSGSREIRILVGGHNLLHNVPEFRVSRSASPGQVRVEREGYTNIVYIHEQDVGKIHAILKIAATNPTQLSDLPRFTKLANEALPYAEGRPIRARKEVVPINYYQGVRGHRPKKKRSELLAMLGYDDVAHFQRANRLPETGALDNATLALIEKKAQPVEETLERIGMPGSSVEEKLQRYLRHLKDLYGYKEDGLNAEALQIMEREKELLSLLNRQPTASSQQPITLNFLHARIVPGHNRRFAVVSHENGYEAWEFDHRQILRRKIGREGLKMLEDDQVERIKYASRQRDDVTFARFSYFSDKDAQVDLFIGDQKHTFSRQALENALEGQNPQLLEEIRQVIYQAYGNGRQTILFMVDGLAQHQPLSRAVQKEMQNGKMETIEEVLPYLEDSRLGGVRMANPHKMAALLADVFNKDASSGGAPSPLRFGLSSTDLPKAWENASSMKTVASGKDVTVASNKKVIDANLFTTLSSYAEEAGMKMYDRNMALENESVIVISGLKGEKLQAYIEELGGAQALKDKYVILLSCFEMSDEVKYNSALIQRWGAKGILFFDERIHNPAVGRVMKEFSNQVNQNKNLDLYDLFRSSANEALKKAEAENAHPLIIEYLKTLSKGIFQYSFEDDYLNRKVFNIG